MKVLSYDQCKKVYVLFQKVHFWAVKNEFVNSVLAFEDLASYLWDIDEEVSQKCYDLVHSMDDHVYFKRNKINEFYPKAELLKFQAYMGHMCYYDSKFKYLVVEAPKIVKQCNNRESLSYQSAMKLAEYMGPIDRAVMTEYLKKIGVLLNSYYGQYDKLAELVKEYSGKMVKVKVASLERGF